MGNPQAKVSDIEIGWVAGFFDGEGTVALTMRERAGKNGGPKIQPMCLLQATDQESLGALTDILTRAEMGYHVAWAQPRGFTRAGKPYRMAWSLRLVGLRRVKRFLEWMLPTLRTKQARAVLALEYIGERLSHSDPRTPITERELAIAHRMRVLNASKRLGLSVTLNTEPPGASSETLAANGRKGAETRWGIRVLASTTAR